MQLFFASHIENDLAYLEASEARHCVQVLRKKPGDHVHFIDGKGGLYESEIVECSKRQCVLKILSKTETFEKRGYHLHMAVAPTKNIDRFEWFLEKAAEIGIDEITPLLCRRSERRKLRNDRLEKILLSATKQSLKTYLPRLNELSGFPDFVSDVKNADRGQKFIAHCQSDDLDHLKSVCKRAKDALILIGPEGDFSKEEIQLAVENGFKAISLGRSRLRTETAGIVACHIVSLVNGDW